ncbi:cell wall metabolism sensor histidine kinase WalK [Acidaminobacter sp. JC074]|uniref:sensor histidine kinase n=1 Tax=Acidaminobacter sp. JC074 TaxID=2530199 RepID=UPI001F1064F4|nr:HAMP domain-containing sensor histidine kinase [Acidaminobacter sp. JC074]
MTIRKLIQKSNAFIVLVSLITFFTIIFAVVALFSRDLLRSLGNDENIDTNLFYVHAILENNIERDWNSIKDELSLYDYDLAVIDGNDLVFETRKELGRLAESFFTLKSAHKEYSIYQRDAWTILRRNVSYDDKVISIYAVKGYNQKEVINVNTETIQLFIINFLILGVLLIFSLMIVSYIFTNKMVKRIMKPVDLLMAGVKRIEQDDFTETIEYSGELEFEKLCSTFNEMQQYLLKEMQKNTAYDKARTDMVSGISHDLRTPLTSIKGFLKGMKDGVANTPEKRSKYIEISYKKAEEMEQLINQLYFYSKIESKKMPFNFEVIDLRSVVRHLVESKQEDFIDKVKFTFSQTENQLLCEIDPNQFHRVITNIVENSIKYSLVESIEVDVSLDVNDDFIVLTIADNGLGMNEEKIKKVFEQFYRGDESRNNSIEGSGLGLYLCQQIIERHGGRIDAYNNNGFVVEVYLPSYKEV